MPTTIDVGRDRQRAVAGAAVPPTRWPMRPPAAPSDRAGLPSTGDVDLLVNAGIYHDRNLGEPALAALIQEDIGANPEDPHGDGHGTFSFDVANGSGGMLTGLQVADGFLRAGTIRHALDRRQRRQPRARPGARLPVRRRRRCHRLRLASGRDGLQGFRFASPPGRASGDARRARRADDGLRATVGFAAAAQPADDRRSDPAFATTAGTWAGEVADKLLADQGLPPGDVDLVVANPLTPAFLDALAARLGVERSRVVEPPGARVPTPPAWAWRSRPPRHRRLDGTDRAAGVGRRRPGRRRGPAVLTRHPLPPAVRSVASTSPARRRPAASAEGPVSCASAEASGSTPRLFSVIASMS